MMRRVGMKKGSLVRVIDTGQAYTTDIQMAKKLGVDESKFSKMANFSGQEGKVVGSEDGYVLIDFGDSQMLFDISGVEAILKPEKVKYVIKYVNTGNGNTLVEEYESEKDMHEDVEEMIKKQEVKLGGEIKVYEVTSAKTLKVELDFTLK